MLTHLGQFCSTTPDVEDPPAISLYEAVFHHYALLGNTPLPRTPSAGDAGKEEAEESREAGRLHPPGEKAPRLHFFL